MLVTVQITTEICELKGDKASAVPVGIERFAFAFLFLCLRRWSFEELGEPSANRRSATCFGDDTRQRAQRPTSGFALSAAPRVPKFVK